MNQEANEVLTKDPVMAGLIKKYGELTWSTDSDIYADLIEAIVGQQLSEKAAGTIFKRFTDLFPNDEFPEPKLVLDKSDDELRSVGLSWAKTEYVKGVCRAVVEEPLILENLRELADDLVIAELTKLKGVGKWTAEMILIFTLKRPDVFSLGDLGLRTAVSRLYGIDRDNLKAIEATSLVWKPFRSIACRYLWKSLDNSFT